MRVLIAGANGDIGYAVLNYFIENNDFIFAIDKNISRLSIKNDSYSDMKILHIDFCRIDNGISQLNELDEPFDVVVYAAGIREIAPVVDLSLDEWRKIFDVNLTAAFIVSQCAIKLAKKHRHPLCIIYISSISGLYGEPERSAYCASKHGLIGLTKSLAIELAEHNIRVNAIAPGI
ncbi:MAG: SDR family NAD(P)-dependent oxidoreductase, partial [Gammaproteobacteria bacterium]